MYSALYINTVEAHELGHSILPVKFPMGTIMAKSTDKMNNNNIKTSSGRKKTAIYGMDERFNECYI